MAAPTSFGVHVTVPETVAAHDDDRVADRSPAVLELVDPLVGQVEEVHHLVALLADVERPVLRMAVRDRREGLADDAVLVALVGLGDRFAGHHVQRGVEQQQETGTAGVDDTRLLQHRELFGRAVECPLAGVAGGVGATSTSDRPSSAAAVAAPALSRTTVRIVPSIGFNTA